MLSLWVKLLKAGTLGTEDSVNVVRFLVNPMVLWAVTHGQLEMLTPEVVVSLVSDVFQSSEGGSTSEQLQVELIQLCSTVLQHAYPLFQEHKKELIQYIW